MSKKQQRRADILNRVLSGKNTKSEAEMLLQLSRRQLNRVFNDYQAEGLSSLVHGNTGKAPMNKTKPESTTVVLALAGEVGKYHGFNICHMHDLLADNEGIMLGRSTLDQLLRANDIVSKTRHKKQVRHKRRSAAVLRE